MIVRTQTAPCFNLCKASPLRWEGALLTRTHPEFHGCTIVAPQARSVESFGSAASTYSAASSGSEAVLPTPTNPINGSTHELNAGHLITMLPSANRCII